MFEKKQQENNYDIFSTEENARTEAETKREIEEYFGEVEETENFEEDYNKDRGTHSKKRRLDKKYQTKRANPSLRNPWKQRKTWEHQNKCFDHICAVRTREKVVEKDIRKGLITD